MTKEEAIAAEKRVAEKAKRMLQSALQSKIRSLDLNFNMDDNEESMFDASVASNFDDKSEDTYFNRLSIRMPRYGFIQHYGIMQGTQREYDEPRKSALGKRYITKPHFYKKGMKGQNYISDAIESSGAVNYICEEMTKIRCQQIFALTKQFFNK